MNNVLEYLLHTADRLPDKPAFVSGETAITFRQLWENSQRLGAALAPLVRGTRNAPICVLAERDADALVCMLACLFTGNYYVLVDASLPQARIEQMLESIDALGVIRCDGKTEAAGTRSFCISYPAALPEAPSCDLWKQTRDFDPMFGVFTSGSTGVPKLAVKSHRAMISFIDTFAELFQFQENEILGNQFPFYFDASTKDLFLCLKCGITTHIIPKECFSFPKQLVQYLAQAKITTIIWVPSALCLVANARALEALPHLQKVFFVGEQMPVKQLNDWKTALPDTRFVNLYGSTEVAGNFLYHEYTEMLDEHQRLPTGIPFPNVRVFLLDDAGNPVTAPDVLGEICVTGPTLSLGYLGDPEKTAKVFVQNPLTAYRETIYKTGDLAAYNAAGQIVWASRRDFQIKHMGYRIELSEIEIVVGAVPGIEECCCTYDWEKKRILLYYQAQTDLKKDIASAIRVRLPKYMFPSQYLRLDAMPHNPNGKIDRKALWAR